MEGKILILDGYIDTPACLGVPPYLSPLTRYIFGSIKRTMQVTPNYLTVDQYRASLKSIRKSIYPRDKLPSNEKHRYYQMYMHKIQQHYQEIQVLIIISGVSVPGKYLSADPIKFSEMKQIKSIFPNARKILCGPAVRYGIGEEGGKPSISIEKATRLFDFIIKDDAEIAFLDETVYFSKNLGASERKAEIKSFHRENINQINEIALTGAEIIQYHPNYRKSDGGNLICEIETFRGCPRYRSGGCSFCIEPSKGKTQHRDIDSIIHEITILYEHGVRHFRIGNQADFYAIHHKEWIKSRYPQPNPQIIEYFLSSIRKRCPDIITLHIDNVNPLNFVLYPEEAKLITQSIVKYCTPGNIAAFGVESLDPIVIQKNNLKIQEDELFAAIKLVNQLGAKMGENGAPSFLPGLNFIMGLPGESKASLQINYDFLQKLLKNDLLVRRINLRKLLVSSEKNNNYRKEITSHLRKFQSNYHHWKNQIRETIDLPILRKVFPFGTVLTDVYSEKQEGNGTLLRQVGSYPIICYVPSKIPLNEFYKLKVIDHGFRSITCLTYPIDFKSLTLKELEAIPGIGKKRAQKIILNRPNLRSEWISIIGEELWESRIKFLYS